MRRRYEQGIKWSGTPSNATRGTHSKRSIFRRTLFLMVVCGVLMFIPLGWKLWDIAIVHQPAEAGLCHLRQPGQHLRPE